VDGFEKLHGLPPRAARVVVSMGLVTAVLRKVMAVAVRERSWEKCILTGILFDVGL